MKTPILRMRGVLLACLQEDLNDEELIAFQSDLACKVTETEASGVVIDITALDIVDSFMARVINETAHMVRLLGAVAVICGMQPAVAMTLIEMGRGLIDVETTLNLDQAMTRLEERIAAQRGSGTDGDEHPEQTDRGIPSEAHDGGEADRKAA